MSDVTLSSAVRSNLLSLQSTADLMSQTQERLATGLKVNSALDNPTNFFTASALNSRASDLARLLDGVSNATQTLEAADNGISAITKLVESAQATARQALQTPGTIETAAVLNGSSLANDNAASVTGTVDLGTDSIGLTGTTVAGLNADDTAATLTGAAVTGTNNSDTVFEVGETVTIDVGGTARTYEFVANQGDAAGGSNVAIALNTTGGAADIDIDTVLAAIETDAQAQGGALAAVTVGVDGGNISVSTGAVGAGVLTVTDNTAGGSITTAAFGGNAAASDTNSTLAGLSGNLSVTGTGVSGSIDLNTIDSASDLSTALGTLTGVTASVGANGITFSAGADDFTVGGTDAAALGFGTGNTASERTNATIGGLSGTLTVGDDTLTFGSGNIETRDDLDTALAGLTGVTGTVNGSNQLVLTSDDATQALTIGGTAAASAGFTAGTTTGTNTALAAATGTVSITIGDTSSDIDLSAISSVEQLTTALSSVTGATYDATDGRVEITASNSDDDIVIAGADAGALGLTAGTTSGSTETNSARGDFVDQYNELMGQIDELAEDSGFNGVNLLNGDDLSVIFNEDGSSTLSIAGVNFDADGLGLAELASTGLDTDTAINTTLSALDTAIGSLRTQASEFGSNLSIVETREDFTKSMINTLETGAANLTLADTNEEGANLLALQTRQQLSSTALSLASQADQNVLRLF